MKNVIDTVYMQVGYFVHDKPNMQLRKKILKTGEVRTNGQLWFQIQNNLKLNLKNEVK